MADFTAGFAKVFEEEVSTPEKVMYWLARTGVSWHGIVLRGLEVFTPSLPYSEAVVEFSAHYGLRQWVGNPTVRIRGTVGLVYDYWSVNNYYHWMVDSLPRLLLLQAQAPGCRLLLPAQPPAYMLLTAKALGFTDFYFLPKGFYAHGADVIMPGHVAPPGRQDAALLLQVRTELLRAYPPPPLASTRRRIYASRREQTTRRLLNEDELLPLLAQYGFEVVDFSDMTLPEQITLLQATEVLMGLHGANLTNALFLPPQAQVIELLDEAHPNLCYFHLASTLGLRYGALPCQAEVQAEVHENNYDVRVLLPQVAAYFEKNLASM